MVATDKDLGSNAMIDYSLSTSTSAAFYSSKFFQIDSTTGLITVKANIDYETDKMLL